jgi:hypothetical protein
MKGCKTAILIGSILFLCLSMALACAVLSDSGNSTASATTAKANLNIAGSAPGRTQIPLIDMTPQQNYLGFQGGLYENTTNLVPADHHSAGMKFAAQVTSTNGKIIVLSLGMSNTMNEYGAFIRTYGSSPNINSAVVLVNGAQGGIGPCAWSVPFGSPSPVCHGNAPNPYDVVKNTKLTPAGLTESQVKVIWIKEANAMSLQLPWPPSLASSKADAYVYEDYIGGMLRAAKRRYPNLKLAFISSRIYGGYNQTSKNHEPYAYEYGFSVKWAIQAQINQADRGGRQDTIAGDLSYSVAPWAAWGPYLWADGNTPRSDGLVWCNGQPARPCEGEVDFVQDGLHPNANGQIKVAKMLMNFFSTSPYTTWFRP